MQANHKPMVTKKTEGRAIILEARFYNEIADDLASGAIATLEQAGMQYDRMTVPGSLELPTALKWAAQSGKYDCYVVLGCIIRGETYHFEIVCNETARGIHAVALELGLPVGNGVLTTENIAQAMDRADPARQNKGGWAAYAAIHMLEMKRQLAGRAAPL